MPPEEGLLVAWGLSMMARHQTHGASQAVGLDLACSGFDLGPTSLLTSLQAPVVPTENGLLKELPIAWGLSMVARLSAEEFFAPRVPLFITL